MSSNRRQTPISKVYFVPGWEVTDKYLMSLHESGGCTCYIDLDEIVEDYFKMHKGILHVVQYDIPLEQQQKILDVYNETNNEINFDIPGTFSATWDVGPKELINYENYAGYWEFSKDKDTNIINEKFIPRTPNAKSNVINVITVDVEALSHQVERLKEINQNVKNIKSDLKYGTVFSVVAAALSTQLLSPVVSVPLLLGCLTGLAYELRELNKNVAEGNKIRSNMISSTFFSRDNTTNLSSLIGDLIEPPRQSFR